jgi:hypothetical protein
MNVVPRFVRCLIAMIAYIMAGSDLAVASETANGATFRLAMGPMSAAQKNQGQETATKSDKAPIKPHHRIRHRRIHHAR